MKKLVILLAFLSVFEVSYGAKIHIIKLTNEPIEINNRKFYIDSVIDNRTDKTSIGIVKKGLFNSRNEARFESSLSKSLKKYFDNSMPKEVNHVPIILEVNKLEISEKTTFANEYGYAEISLVYYYNTTKLFNDVQHVEVTSVDVTNLHDDNIKEVFRNSFVAFHNSDWLNILDGQSSNEISKGENPLEISTINSSNPEKNAKESTKNQEENFVNKSKNIVAIGYQIGGYTLVGLDYEIRVQDFFGIHFGFGLSGYTAGVKIHTNPMKNSSFFNFSFKDGGFGLIEAAGIEYGGRWVFNKKSDFGLHYQIGLVSILKIDEGIRDKIFKSQETPDVMMSMGIGVSW